MTVTIHQGDALEVLKTMDAKSINCSVTSPPYWGLRDYGVEGQLGLERTPDEYVAKLVEVFREVRRVLRDDGTLWLNLGDSYNGYMANQRGTGLETKRQQARKYIEPGAGLRFDGLKNKDLIGIPWMVAFALRADGWYLRQDIIWHKPNPMPESVTDRCTKAHEYIFLMSKSQRYYYDAESIEEDAKWERWGNQTENKKHVGTAGHLGNKSISELPIKDSKNKRSVWICSTSPYPSAHFATFPPKLIEPCILAGCPQGGTVLDPFGGSGTTGMVAEQNGRNSILIELNTKYVDMARKRTAQVGLFCDLVEPDEGKTRLKA